MLEQRFSNAAAALAGILIFASYAHSVAQFAGVA